MTKEMPAQTIPSARRSGGPLHGVSTYVGTFARFQPDARRMLAANLCLNIGVGVYGVLFNLYLVNIGQSLVYIGFLSAVSSVVQAAVAIPLASALRRFTPSQVMLVGTAGLSLAYLLSPLMTNATILTLLTLLAGTGFAVGTVPAGPYMMDHARAHERSHLFSAYFAAATSGNMIGSLLSGIIPLLGVLLPRTLGPALIAGERAGLVVGGLLTGVGAWFFWTLVRPHTSEERGTPEGQDRPVAALMGGEIADPPRTLRRDVVTMLIGLAFLAYSLGSTLPFFNVYLSERLHASTATIGTVFALSGVVCTLASFLAPLTARWGMLAGFNGARALSAPAFMVFWLHPGLGVAAAAYILRNSMGTISGALEGTFGMEIIPARLRGIVASWRSFAFNAGWSVGSLASGVIVVRFGYEIVFLASGVLTLMAVAVYQLHFRERYDRRS